MTVASEFQAANEKYTASFTKGDLPMPPGRKVAAVVCMDARIDPARALGLEEGDSHVIRNAGGLVTDDALRSLIISEQLLGTQEIVVVHHTDCGMLTFTNDVIHSKLKDTFGQDASSIDFLPFGDLEESVRRDIAKIKASPFIPESFPVTGFIYDVKTGKINKVD